MRTKFLALIVGVGLFWTMEGSAHHSFVVEYDADAPVTLDGVVTRFDWTNPHVLLQLDVETARGKGQSWSFEMPSPNVLARGGWTRGTLKVGDRITVEGFRGLAVPTRGTVRSVATADGVVRSVGAEAPGAPVAPGR
jgi:hypothetical protein